MTNIRRALSLTALDSYLSAVLQILSTMIIARLLTPADLGTYAVGAVFAALAGTLRDFGVASYVIREKNLTPKLLRAVLGVNLLTSWGISAALALASQPLAEFYRTPGLALVMQIQALGLALVPFGAVSMALYRREMRFRLIVAIHLAANTTSTVVAVGMAWLGYGFVSLAWSSVAGVLVTLVLTAWKRPPELPRWPSLRGAMDVMKFGAHISSSQTFSQIGRGAPELIIGRAQDMASVGIFGRAQGVVELFNMLVIRAIWPVCLPYFSAEVRQTGSPRGAQLRAMQLVTGVGWPFFAVLGLSAEVAIRIVYGPQWGDAVPVARIICAVAFLEITFITGWEALVAIGMAAKVNSLQIQIQTLRVCGLCAAFFAGLEGAAWGLLLGTVLGLVLFGQAMKSHIGIGWVAAARCLLPSLTLAAVTAVPAAALLFLWPMTSDNHLLLGLGLAGVSAVAWLAGAAWIGHPIFREARTAAASVRGLLPGLR